MSTELVRQTDEPRDLAVADPEQAAGAEVVVGEIRRSSEVGLRSRYPYPVIGVACADCGKGRWTMLRRGKRPIPQRCVSCSGKRTHPLAVAGNAKPRPWQSERQRGERNHMWNGGRVRGGNGYVYILLAPDDPFRSMANAAGYAMEHRLVMAQANGRPLARWEQVHHLNGIRDDNRIENLELWKKSQPAGIRQADYHCPGCRCGEES